MGAVEDRCREGHALGQVLRQFDQLFLILRQRGFRAVDMGQTIDQRLLLTTRLPGFQQTGDLLAQTGGGPTQVGFEDLADVHARRHAQRVQNDVDVGAVFQVRHVLDRQDLGDDALVAVTAGHLVAGLQLALHRHEDLDHLHHAGGQFVAALQLLDLVFETTVQLLAGVFELALHRFQLAHGLFVVQGDLPPQTTADLGQLLFGQFAAADALGSRHGVLADDQRLQAAIDVALQDLELVVAVLAQTFDLGAFDRHGALVLVDAVTVEDANVHDRAGDAGRQAQGGVAHVRSLLAEDGAQQLLFRGHRAFALRRHLADQDVARLDLGTDGHDARFVEVAQGFLADVGDVARDFFRPELRIAGGDFELFQVDRGEDVVAHDALGDQDGVFEVVAVPGHEGDQGVAAQGQFAQVRRRTVGDHVAALHLIAHAHDRALVDAGRLVRTLELRQTIDVDARAGGVHVACGAHDNAGAVDLFDDAVTTGDHDSAGVHGDDRFHAGADQRRVRLHQRHGLTLHVGAHQRAVGVVVFQERDQGRSDRNDLFRRHVHHVHGVLVQELGFTVDPAGD